MPSGDGRCAATLWQSAPMPRCPLFGLAGLLNEARPIEDGAGRRVRSVGWAGNKTSISKRPIGEFVLGASNYSEHSGRGYVPTMSHATVARRLGVTRKLRLGSAS